MVEGVHMYGDFIGFYLFGFVLVGVRIFWFALDYFCNFCRFWGSTLRLWQKEQSLWACLLLVYYKWKNNQDSIPMNIGLMLFMWTPKAYGINILIVTDASLNPAYLVLSNVIRKHFKFICEIGDDPAGENSVKKLLRMWSHPSGKSHINKRRYLHLWGVLLTFKTY